MGRDTRQNGLRLESRHSGRCPHHLWPLFWPVDGRDSQWLDLQYRLHHRCVRWPKTLASRSHRQHARDPHSLNQWSLLLPARNVKCRFPSRPLTAAKSRSAPLVLPRSKRSSFRLSSKKSIPVRPAKPFSWKAKPVVSTTRKSALVSRVLPVDAFFVPSVTSN